MVHKQFSGISLMVLGSLALLQVFGMYNFGLAFWPAVLLWFGLEIVWGSLFDHWSHPSVVGTALGLFVAGLGLVQILANAGLAVAVNAGDLLRLGWPVLLVALGIGLLFRRGRHWHWNLNRRP